MAVLLDSQLVLNLSVCVLPHVHGIVDHVVLVIEPEHAVVGLRMQAGLARALDELLCVKFIRGRFYAHLLHEETGSEQLEE